MLTNIFKRLRRLGDNSSEAGSEPTAASKNAVVDRAPNTYASDLPIENLSQDRFGRAAFARRVADTLAHRTDPTSLCVAILGPWGDGKTSVLHLMKKELEKRQEVVVVEFNPWRFKSEDDLLHGFFDALAGALQRSLSTRREELGKLLRDYSFVLAPAGFGGKDIAKGIGEKMAATSLETLKARIEGILEEAGVRVVMMIDDIDRLDSSEIQAMFKLVKLSAGFRNMSYVLAFDDAVVASALGEKYGEGGAEAGRRFLEKIVQVPLHLPPPDVIELRRLLLEGVDSALVASSVDLNQAQADAFVQHFVDGLELALRTPRQAKLYGNALLFALPLLKGEVWAVDQMLIEGIRVFYPKLYLLIRDHQDLFTQSEHAAENSSPAHRAEVTRLIDASLDPLGEEDRNRIRSRLLEVLFPRLRNMGYGSDWDREWAKDQRICSSEYFQRYFTYGIPPRDVSDVVVAQFVEAAEAGKQELTADIWNRFAGTGAIEQFVRKLRAHEKSVSATAGFRIATLIAQRGAAVPRQKAMMLNDWAFMQTAILIAALVRRTNSGPARFSAAEQILKVAEPLQFAIECLRWLRTEKDEKPDERLLTAKEEEELGALIASRAKLVAARRPLYREFGQDAPRVFWVWNKFGKPGEVSTHIESALNSGDDEIDAFLDTFVGTAWGMESRLSHRSDLDRASYDAIAKLVPASFVYEKLEKRYGDALDFSAFHFGKDTPLELRIANQFAFIHQKVMAEASHSLPSDVLAGDGRGCKVTPSR